MNQEVFQEIYQEITEQQEIFERIGELMQKIPSDQITAQLEKAEAALEYFIHRMKLAFRNEDERVCESLKYLLVKASLWDKIKNISEAKNRESFIKNYFEEIREAFRNFISEAQSIPKNQDKMGLVLIVKNEERYLPEWIEYHKAVGINRFFIYDNESTDHTREVLQSYIDEGSVTYTWCPGKKRQLPVYMDALDRFRYEVKYIGAVDADEFILPVQGESVPDLVDKMFEMNPGIGGVAVSWRIFGSDGQVHDNGRPVIGTFIHRAENSFWQHQHIKTIVNPRKALYPLSPHHFVYTEHRYTVNERGSRVDGPYDQSGEDQDCSVLQINHYYVKSREYWVRVKMKRGFADLIGNYEDKYFDINDRNEILDDRMLKYLPIVEQNLRKRGLLHE
ncbi:Glycosyltransferase family 92 [Lachnospiraceae bacterium]|nr:Glycosyltransferase family 92 [Lachnospiraceae bacterium]